MESAASNGPGHLVYAKIENLSITNKNFQNLFFLYYEKIMYATRMK